MVKGYTIFCAYLYVIIAYILVNPAGVQFESVEYILKFKKPRVQGLRDSESWAYYGKPRITMPAINIRRIRSVARRPRGTKGLVPYIFENLFVGPLNFHSLSPI